MTVAEISQCLTLNSITSHPWHVQACCALTGEGWVHASYSFCYFTAQQTKLFKRPLAKWQLQSNLLFTPPFSPHSLPACLDWMKSQVVVNWCHFQWLKLPWTAPTFALLCVLKVFTVCVMASVTETVVSTPSACLCGSIQNGCMNITMTRTFYAILVCLCSSLSCNCGNTHY